MITPYEPYLLQRWEEGCRTATVLWREIRAQGFAHSLTKVQRFVAELRPLPLAVYEEPIPVFEGWPDAPCGYLRFGANPAYDAPAERARRDGWAYREMDGAHFHMLGDPAAVAGALLDLVEQMGVSDARRSQKSGHGF